MKELRKLTDEILNYRTISIKISFSALFLCFIFCITLWTPLKLYIFGISCQWTINIYIKYTGRLIRMSHTCFHIFDSPCIKYTIGNFGNYETVHFISKIIFSKFCCFSINTSILKIHFVLLVAHPVYKRIFLSQYIIWRYRNDIREKKN